MRALRGGAVLAAATILLLFSKAIPWQPLFQIAIGLYALVVVCLLWIANSLWGLRFDRPAPVKRGQAGQTYVFERNGTYYESRVSFYNALRGLDLTMGAQTKAKNIEE